MDEHRAILKRVGFALVVAGALDIGYMIYCISNGVGYSSSFNIFALIAGIFLIKGHLGAVRLVTWFSAFMLAGFAAALPLFPLLRPAGLWAVEFRLNPTGFALSIVVGLMAMALLFWVYRQLRSAPVLAARVAAGHSAAPPKLAFISGLALVVSLVIILKMIMGGASVTKAIEMARAQHGDSYKYHVDAMRWSMGHARARLTAYNEREIKAVQVEWQE